MEKTQVVRNVGDQVKVGRGAFTVMAVNADGTLTLRNDKTGETVTRKANLRKCAHCGVEMG